MNRDDMIVEAGPCEEGFESAPRWRRIVTSLGLALLVATCLGVGFAHGEAFPFSTFPMYSSKHLDPYIINGMRIYAFDAEGNRYQIRDLYVRNRTHSLRAALRNGKGTPERIRSYTDEITRLINDRQLTPALTVGIRVFDVRLRVKPMSEHGPAARFQERRSTLVMSSMPEAVAGRQKPAALGVTPVEAGVKP